MIRNTVILNKTLNTQMNTTKGDVIVKPKAVEKKVKENPMENKNRRYEVVNIIGD